MSECAVRLEGGVGDHILGLRVVKFVRARFPDYEIVAYCDCAGCQSQLDVAAMSPFVSRIVPVHQCTPPQNMEEMGRIERLRPLDLAMVASADLVIDTHGANVLTAASHMLDVPLFEMLAHRPELVIPSDAIAEGKRLLGEDDGRIYVGLNLTKYGAAQLRQFEERLLRWLGRLLADPRVVVLNIFMSCDRFPHWPEAEHADRRRRSLRESAYLRALCTRHERILPCVDVPIPVAAALLARCTYFIGLDNGLKHLAWALGVPHSFLHPSKPTLSHALRWMPDLNRLLLFDCDEASLNRHIAQSVEAMGI